MKMVASIVFCLLSGVAGASELRFVEMSDAYTRCDADMGNVLVVAQSSGKAANCDGEPS